jgi:hypothetical protein
MPLPNPTTVAGKTNPKSVFGANRANILRL